jgi:hypothetical protein
MIYLGTTYQNGGKYTKCPQNVPNAFKIKKTAIKIPKCHDMCQKYPFNAFQVIPKLGPLVCKYIWQPWF